jgi:hypothetical protein
MEENLEDQYSNSSSFIFAFLVIRVESNAHTHLCINGGAQTILGVHRMQQDDMI